MSFVARQKSPSVTGVSAACDTVHCSGWCQQSAQTKGSLHFSFLQNH